VSYDNLLVLPDLEKLAWTTHPRRGCASSDGAGLGGYYQAEFHSHAAFGPFKLELTKRPAYTDKHSYPQLVKEGYKPEITNDETSHWICWPRYSSERFPRPPHDLFPSPEAALAECKDILAREIKERGYTPLMLARTAFTMGFEHGSKGNTADVFMTDPNYRRGAEMGALNVEYTAHIRALRTFWAQSMGRR
jgi:hypothetical protein